MTTLRLLPGPGAVIRKSDLVVMAVGEITGGTVEGLQAAIGSADLDAAFGAAVSYLQTAGVDGGGVVHLDRHGSMEVWATGAVRVVSDTETHDAATYLAGLSLRFPVGTLRSIAAITAPAEPGWQSIESGAASGAGFVLVGTDDAPVDAAPSAGSHANQSGAELAGAAEPAEPEPQEHEPQVAEPEPQDDQPFVAVSLSEPIDLSDLQPLPTADVEVEAVASDQPAYAVPQIVLGVLSPGGHFNHPEARYCSRTGVKMGASATRALTEGVRPPLGVLTFDNGSTYSVQHDTVIGREPETDERVENETAAPLSVLGDNQEVSRRHLFMELVDWDVFITDLDTANGTHIRESANQEVRRLVPGQRTALPGGAEVFIGTTRFQYHEHHVR